MQMLEYLQCLQFIQRLRKDFPISTTVPSVSEIWTSWTCILWFGARVELISGNNKAAKKIIAYVKSGLKWHKSNQDIIEAFNKGMH